MTIKTRLGFGSEAVWRSEKQRQKLSLEHVVDGLRPRSYRECDQGHT